MTRCKIVKTGFTEINRGGFGSYKEHWEIYIKRWGKWRPVGYLIPLTHLQTATIPYKFKTLKQAKKYAIKSGYEVTE